jgi:hypothetical protein
LSVIFKRRSCSTESILIEQSILSEQRHKHHIVDFEKGRSTPVKNNLAAIQRVLEEADVEFTNGDAPGLRLRKKKR